ncbi:MAG: minor capsid protein [Acidimicrobiia bacterium]|nr:minor capsid protein [Acidimicrobiia bacterium]
MLAVEIAQYLAAQIGALTFNISTTGGNVFVDSMPSTPDEAVMVKGSGGPEASTKSGYALPAVQVIVRGTTDPRTGSDRADQVYAALHGLRHTTLAGGTLVIRSAGIQSAPVSMGEDQNGRHEFSLNFQLETRLQTTHSLE